MLWSSQKQAADSINDDLLFLLGPEGSKFWEGVKKKGREIY